ncbi:uncharacterized protein V1510DRAFT_365049 [Dipodascopsis tothii]|uniref:uncharacterized protein n=1 Tax=Dipodascopsis tothii TaxID=44089 RepID=UPI0034CDD5D3
MNPSDAEIVAAVAAVRAAEPGLGIAKVLAQIKADHAGWSLSLNRLKAVAKAATGAAVPQDVAATLYVEQTRSAPVPSLQLPPSVRVVDTAARGGKGLEAAAAAAAGAELWAEPALVLVPPLALLTLIPSGQACSHCAKPLQISTPLVASCTYCAARWCSSRCRTRNAAFHKKTRHSGAGEEWTMIERFAVDNQWQGVYGYAYVLAASRFDDPGNQRYRGPGACASVAEGVAGLARVGQDVRQRADPQAASNIFAEEQAEMLWQEGHGVVAKFFAKLGAPPTYEEFLEGLGMININNLDGSIYLLQSHLNHSCEPNVDVKFVTRTAGVRVVALQALRPGDELTTTYVDLRQDVAARRRQLHQGWGFWCTCARCVREA